MSKNNPLDRGFLRNYPLDVVRVINGHPITKSDILENKRLRQRRRLEWKRRNWESVLKPCFIWTFHVDAWIYHGWWLYVLTARKSFGVTLRNDKEMALKIMGLFPCGYLPIVENFDRWKAEFARTYHRPTKKRPDRNGLALAWAELSHNGRLLDVFKDHPNA